MLANLGVVVGDASIVDGTAEFVATVKAGTTALGIRSLAADFGDELTIEIGTDSGAAKGILSRVGLGRI